MVEDYLGCPLCGECDADYLVFGNEEDGTVYCTRCMEEYEPGGDEFEQEEAVCVVEQAEKGSSLAP